MLILNKSLVLFFKKIKLFNISKLLYLKFLQSFIVIEQNTVENYLIKNIKKFFNKNNNCIIDIGAHKGDKTNILLKFFPNSTFYLFEPFPRYFNILKKRFNNKKNIFIKKLSLSNKKGEKNFFYTDNKIYEEGFSLLKNNYLDKHIIVKTIKLDYCFFKKKISIIKIDAEGNVPNILYGGIRTINKNLPIIFIETSDFTHNKIEKFFKKIKYKIYVYEYFIFNSNLNNHAQLGTIKENNIYLIKKSDRFKLRCYTSNDLKKYKTYVTNCIALPINKNFLKDEKIYPI
jgi:hypothetical protein